MAQAGAVGRQAAVAAPAAQQRQSSSAEQQQQRNHHRRRTAVNQATHTATLEPGAHRTSLTVSASSFFF